MKVVNRGVVAILLVAGWSGRGAAAPTPEQDADLTPTARAMSDKALRQYQQGEYDAAIESFMSAFALSNNVGLLFNVAQAYRLKGDCARAKENYQRYLDAAPETALKSSVARRVTEMDGCLKASTTIASGPPGEAPPANAPANATAPEAARVELPTVSLEKPPGVTPRRRALAWTLGGSAAALLASSAVFGGAAWSAYADHGDTSEQIPAADANDRFLSHTRAALIFAASGLICAVASYLIGRHQ